MINRICYMRREAMASREELRQRIIDAIEQHRDEIIEVAETIRLNPEIGYEEYQSSALLASKIDEQPGFEVEKPIGGLETAFRATRHGRGDGPTIAVLAEYDALPGLGHGCGHNLIAGSGLATAIGLNTVMSELNGTFEVIGTPAEEGGAGKVRLADAGIFDDVDAALMIHHGGHQTGAPTEDPDGTCLAVAHIDIEYFGQTAHAGMDPYNGRNALNGLIKFFTGADALRQHVHMETRLHGIITHGGDAANVVPGYASGKYYVRAASKEQVEDVLAKVKQIAEGAAMMTQTEVKITEHSICYDMRPNYTLGRQYSKNMEEVGLELSGGRKGRAYHSTDFGNISHEIPSVSGIFAISKTPIPGHSQEVVDCSGSEYGYDQFIKVSTAMALTVFDMLYDADLANQVSQEHAERDN
jgi:amidohydrolase